MRLVDAGRVRRGKLPDKRTTIDHRAANLRKFYGLSLADFDAILAGQGGVCAVCEGPPIGRRPQYHVDHDHVSGRVRGVLCHKCNVALGMVGDSSELLRRLAEYVERHHATAA